MTETQESSAITEAIGVIEEALQSMVSRELLSSSEVADLLLDVRGLLVADRT